MSTVVQPYSIPDSRIPPPVEFTCSEPVAQDLVGEVDAQSLENLYRGAEGSEG